MGLGRAERERESRAARNVCGATCMEGIHAVGTSRASEGGQTHENARQRMLGQAKQGSCQEAFSAPHAAAPSDLQTRVVTAFSFCNGSCGLFTGDVQGSSKATNKMSALRSATVGCSWANQDGWLATNRKRKWRWAPENRDWTAARRAGAGRSKDLDSTLPGQSARADSMGPTMPGQARRKAQPSGLLQWVLGRSLWCWWRGSARKMHRPSPSFRYRIWRRLSATSTYIIALGDAVAHRVVCKVRAMEAGG